MTLRVTAPNSVFAISSSHAEAFPKGTPWARHFASQRTLAAIF